jgi:predicted nicotinamide N-methyase
MVLDGGKPVAPQPACSLEQKTRAGLRLVEKTIMPFPAAAVPRFHSHDFRSVCSRLHAADSPILPHPLWIKALWTAGVIVSGCALYWFSA